MNKKKFKCKWCKSTKFTTIIVDSVGECEQCDECGQRYTHRECSICGHPVASVSMINETGKIYLRCSKCLEITVIKEDDPQLVEAYEREQEQLQREQEQLRNNPKCPQCGSTAITAATRGYTFLRGIWGSNDPVNYCKHCGHKWEP